MTENMFEATPQRNTEGMFSIEDTLLSQGKKRKDALQIGMMRSANTGEDQATAYRSVLAEIDSGASVDNLRIAEQGSYRSTTEKYMNDYIIDNAASTDVEVQQRVLSYATNFSGERERFQDQFDGLEQTFTDMYADEDIDAFRQRQVSSKARVYRMMEDQFEEDGFLEDAGNFIAQMITPDDIKDFNDLAGKLGTDFSGLKQIMSDFQTRDPDEQMMLMEVLMPSIVSAFDDNPTAVRSAVEMFYSDDIDTDMMATFLFDALAVPDVIFGGKLAIKGLAKLGSTVARNRAATKKMKDLDNLDMAGAQTAYAGVDRTDEAINAIDLNRVDVASTAHPAKLEDTTLLSGQMDGLASSVQDANKPVLNKIIEDLLPDAGNKLTRGEAKKLRATQQRLNYEIAKLEEAKAVVTKGAVRTGTAKKSVIQQNIDLKKAELEKTKSTLENNKAAAEAHADISRIQQGIIPPRLQGAYEALMKEELSKGARPLPEMPKDIVPAKQEDMVELAGDSRLLDSPEEYGLTPEFVEFIEESVKAPLRKLATTAEKQSLDAISPEAAAAAEARVVKKINARVAKSGQNVNSLDITERTAKGFNVKYTTDAGESGSYKHEFTVKDSGALTSDPKLAKSNVGPAMRKVFSPDVVWADMLGGFIKNITFAGQQSAKMANGLMRKWNEIEAGLSKESRIHVDALLQAGDEMEMVFTPRDLLDGVVELKIGKQGVKREYSKQEVAAYFQKRAFFDEIHRLRNDLTRDQLEFLGYKGVKYTDDKGVAKNLITKKYDDIGTAKAQMGESEFFVPDGMANNQSKFRRGKSARDSLVDMGYEPVKLLEPIRNNKGKVMAEWAMVKTDSIKQVPSQVLNYVPHYVPRVYKPGYFFVKNADSANYETLYAFETRAAATKYADDLRADPASGYDNVVVKEDREFSDLESLVNGADSYGGLYTGHRKSTSQLMVKTDEGDIRPDRLSTAQATQRYIQSVSNVMPINKYRMSVVEQFQNTVNDMAKLEGKPFGIRPEEGFEGPINLSAAAKKEMEETRDYLRDVLSLHSDEESWFRDRMMQIGEVMRGKPGGDMVLNNIHGDPVKAMKGLTFNAHLGWFNPRQLWVQAQNASVALSMHPIAGAKAIAKYPAYRAAYLSDNPEVWRATAQKFGIGADEFVEDMQMFKDSGFLDAIVRTADFDANVAGLGTGTFQTLRKAAKYGRVPYEEGETASRIVAWQVARHNLKEAGAELTTKSISQETVRLHMNLQAENAAAWQKGFLGVPTQFMQVFAKFGENVIPGLLQTKGAKWSRQEAARVLAGQVILYGTVGVPVVESAVAYIADIMGTDPVTLQRENPMILEGIEEGMVGMMFATLGIENNFSEGSSLLAGMDDNVAVELVAGLSDYLSGGNADASVYDIGLGASGNTVKRGVDAMTNLFEAARNLFLSPSMATLGDEAISIIDGLAATTSTWSNARKAYYAKVLGQGLRNKRGSLIMTADELGSNWQSDLVKAFGFPYDREVAFYKLAYDYNMDSKEAVRKTRDDLRDSYLQYQRTGNLELYRKQKALILSGHNQYTARDIEKAHNKETITGGSRFSKEVTAFTLDALRNHGRDPLPLATGTTLADEER